MHIVSGLIRKAPFIKEATDYKMYVVELSELIKDYKTGEKTYTNYKAMFFAKTDNAKNYYDQVFIEGSFVVVSAEKLKPEIFPADSGVTYVTLMMDNARLENAKFEQAQQQGWGKPQQPNGGQPYQQQQQQQTPQNGLQPNHNQSQGRQPVPQYNTPPMDFDDDIPF